mmetsp:Transcript_12703/g.40597  ORF Transcript_12703/g.40597 Transcript_12703/m.40597 type:complete len:229 (-) Transcript_12703:59-745(-)
MAPPSRRLRLLQRRFPRQWLLRLRDRRRSCRTAWPLPLPRSTWRAKQARRAPQLHSDPSAQPAWRAIQGSRGLAAGGTWAGQVACGAAVWCRSQTSPARAGTATPQPYPRRPMGSRHGGVQAAEPAPRSGQCQSPRTRAIGGGLQRQRLAPVRLEARLLASADGDVRGAHVDGAAMSMSAARPQTQAERRRNAHRDPFRRLAWSESRENAQSRSPRPLFYSALNYDWI